ncbi:class I SAM-dependent methyltransferase [Chitinophagaceae bacterium MMS25-I14]
MDSTQRFSNRVADYVKYRPHYSDAVVDYLQHEFGLTERKTIADIGAGTGISSALFLKAGYKVIAVEPNKEMREKSVELLHVYPGFTAVDGTAENTGLDAGSIDAVVAGQAFHWFDAVVAKKEFERILKKEGMVVLLWNERLTGSDFEKEYDNLILQYGKDYVEVRHRNIDLQHIEAFFAPGTCTLKTFENSQDFDFEGLKGRLLSSSYMPVAGEKGYHELITDLQDLFHRYAAGGRIRIHYITKVYTGSFASLRP